MPKTMYIARRLALLPEVAAERLVPLGGRADAIRRREGDLCVLVRAVIGLHRFVNRAVHHLRRTNQALQPTIE